MSLAQAKDYAASGDQPQTTHPAGLLAYLHSWELYLIVLIAAFFRLYQPGTSEFDGDQSAIFRFAREAVQQGLLPIVSNRASIGIENPPGVIYLLMLPASISANPLGAVVMVAVFNILAVLLTYIFVRRYYGRLAGTIAALLYAAAAKPIYYSRFIWQQNMLAPFVVLFLFAIFRGVVERRKGWLLPAIVLLGIMYQLHETAFLLCIPLLLAIVLAHRTIRRRDIGLSVLALLLLFSPYIVWEFTSHFSDVIIILNAARKTAGINGDVIHLFLYFLSQNGFTSASQIPTDPTSVLKLFNPLLAPLRYIFYVLAAGGFVASAVRIMRPTKAFAVGNNVASDLKTWWNDFQSSPERQGIALLLTWQVLPVLFLLRHSVPLYPYYLLLLMPGPFILIAIFAGNIVAWMEKSATNRTTTARIARYGMTAGLVLFIVLQILTSAATLLDWTDGTYGHSPVFNTLGSMQQALTRADQLARQQQLHMIYVTMDTYTQVALPYLAEQLTTSTSVFDDSSCAVLPNPEQGPAIFVVSPYAQLTQALLHSYSQETLLAQLPRQGASPYSILQITPQPFTPAATGTFLGHLQLSGLQQVHAGASFWLVSRWIMQHPAPPATITTYSYTLNATIHGSQTFTAQSTCTVTAIHPGEQLLAAFAMPASIAASFAVTFRGTFNEATPYNPALGPLRLGTDQIRSAGHIQLQTPDGTGNITASLV